MTDFATLHCRIPCWSCKRPFDGATDFQWGALPAQYRLHDLVKWAAVGGVTTPSYTIAPGTRGWNAGDPAIRNLKILDANLFAPDIVPDGIPCPRCRASVATVVTEIEEGRIVRATTIRAGELVQLLDGCALGTVDTFERTAHGAFRPRPDFFNPPVRVMEAGGGVTGTGTATKPGPKRKQAIGKPGGKSRKKAR